MDSFGTQLGQIWVAYTWVSGYKIVNDQAQYWNKGKPCAHCEVFMKRVLFLCTGNSCRSQMAEGIAKHDFAGRLEVFSAGTDPRGLDPRAVQAMVESGIDIGAQTSDHLSKYERQSFDYVITLCGDANERCPLFFGGVKRQHLGFPDPAKAQGTPEEILDEFRRVRDAIRNSLREFFEKELAGS